MGTPSSRRSLAGFRPLGKGIDTPFGVYNEGVELYNRFLKTDDTLPGAKTMTLLIAEASLLSVKNVFATPGRIR